MNVVDIPLKVMMFSALLSKGSFSDYRMEDMEHKLNNEVNECQINLYLWLIKRINDGTSYEEISREIDDIDLESYKSLSLEQQDYVKRDVKEVLVLRQKNEKTKGEIK